MDHITRFDKRLEDLIVHEAIGAEDGTIEVHGFNLAGQSVWVLLHLTRTAQLRYSDIGMEPDVEGS